MASVHLDMMEWERYGQRGLEQTLAIFAPHHHRIAELVGILVDDAVELGLGHSRGANNHVILQETAFAFTLRLAGQFKIFLIESLQVVGKRDVAGVDAAILVVHDDIDGEPVILKQFAVFWQSVKLLNLTRRLSDAPAHP